MSNENTFAISEVMPGKLNALVKNIMRQTGTDDPNEAVRLVNSGEWVVMKRVFRFREQDGVIYFTLPATDGTTGPQWDARLEKKGIKLSKWAKDVLNSQDFKSTTGVVREIAVLKGMLFKDDDRTTKNIRAKADTLGLKHGKDCNPEIACQIREMFTDKEIEEMGLVWITTMHEPIKDSDGDLRLLDVDRHDDGSWLNTSCGSPDDGWDREGGFALVVTQVSPKA